MNTVWGVLDTPRLGVGELQYCNNDLTSVMIFIYKVVTKIWSCRSWISVVLEGCILFPYTSTLMFHSILV